MTPQAFIAKWGPGGPAFGLNEEQGAQSHFIDLCDLLGVPKPGSADGYVFEKQTIETRVIGQARGYADVFMRGACLAASSGVMLKRFWWHQALTLPNEKARGSVLSCLMVGEFFHRPHPSPGTDKAAVENIRKWFEVNGVIP